MHVYICVGEICIHIPIIILKGILLFCQPCFGSTMCCPENIRTALKNVQMATGMTLETSMKALLRGEWLSPYF